MGINFYKRIQELCMRGIKNNMELGEEYSMFRHLIEILGEDNTNSWLQGSYDFVQDKNHFCFSLHKSLRQTDVFEQPEISGNLDMLLYNLIHISEVPFKVFERVYEDNKKESSTETVQKV